MQDSQYVAPNNYTETRKTSFLKRRFPLLGLGILILLILVTLGIIYLPKLLKKPSLDKIDTLVSSVEEYKKDSRCDIFERYDPEYDYRIDTHQIEECVLPSEELKANLLSVKDLPEVKNAEEKDAHEFQMITGEIETLINNLPTEEEFNQKKGIWLAFARLSEFNAEKQHLLEKYAGQPEEIAAIERDFSDTPEILELKEKAAPILNNNSEELPEEVSPFTLSEFTDRIRPELDSLKHAISK